MTSKWQQPEPPPVQHPAFQSIDVDGSKMTGEQRYYFRLVREALTQAYTRTPWHHAVTLQTRRDYVAAISLAVSQVAAEHDRRRVYVVVGQVEAGKRVMIGIGRKFPEGKEPWGPPPEPAPLLGVTPAQIILDEYQPVPQEQFEREYLNDFPPPVKPEES